MSGTINSVENETCWLVFFGGCRFAETRYDGSASPPYRLIVATCWIMSVVFDIGDVFATIKTMKEEIPFLVSLEPNDISGQECMSHLGRTLDVSRPTRKTTTIVPHRLYEHGTGRSSTSMEANGRSKFES